MNRPNQYRRRITAGEIVGQPITRVACDFPGCPLPPAINGKNLRTCRYCHAHRKQKQRTGVLKPVAYRGDVEAKWEEWARARVDRHSTRSLGLIHSDCGGQMRVLNSTLNGKIGYRYCRCVLCEARVEVSPTGRQRITRPGNV